MLKQADACVPGECRMSIGILGKKLGMTRLFGEHGEAIPVTVIEAGPCHIVQVKSETTDGYKAIQDLLQEDWTSAA